MLGVIIKSGIYGALIYIFIAILLIIYTLIFRPKINEEKNEKQKLGKPLFLITFIISFLSIIFIKTNIENIINIGIFTIITYIFYKIFSYSLIVIKEYGIKKVFTLEEITGAAIILMLLSLLLIKINILGISITNILIMIIIMLLGWQNGTVIGITSGTIIGMTAIILGNIDISNIWIYIIAGLLSGLLNKLNKIILGVLIGISNIIITFVFKNNLQIIIYLREIAIAMITLIFLPKNIGINIYEYIGKTKLLPVTGPNRLEYKDENKTYSLESKNKKEKINKNENINNDEKKINNIIFEKKDKKNHFRDMLYNKLEEFEDNFIYEDIVNGEEQILEQIYNILEEKEIIYKEELIKILEENNNYIILIDKKIDETIDNDLNQAIKLINKTYRTIKIDYDWEQRKIDLDSKKSNINKFKITTKIQTIQKSDVISITTINTNITDEKSFIGFSQGFGMRTKSKKK